ncbi:hypothetical protein Lal_00018994 [Lupinus albus]|uniref:Putative BAG domain-containing protein n=1 Tax=Lupinus albus TaxID=3870 RepID=A0A6A5PNF1_LUPAL|nr:putative BAG domain-containing protein [Lupinus albus]KAF1898873.1 hypothetical protein Lal_00018994 [Lupinus albus]
MSLLRRFHIIEEEPLPLHSYYSSPPFPFVEETLTFLPFVEETLGLLPFDLVQKQDLRTELCLQSLSDRVSDLESQFNRIVAGKSGGRSVGGNRKYTWTTEIKGEEGFDRKYKWIAELVEEEKKKKLKTKSIKWKSEIKGKDEAEKNEKKGSGTLRIVEIQEPNAHRDVVLKQAFAKRFGAVQNNRGKKKELSPQDAALLIQISFKAYLIRRSKVLRALRELAVAKSKLKELRAQFNNFSYRHRVARDAEERQRFSEKVIILLLTVDAIEGADLMVRSAKKSIVDELEAMLDVIDPKADGRSLSLKRRQFDMPDGVISKEIEEGVAQVVQMLDEAENSSSTFEV